MFSMIQYKPFALQDYTYPVWATVLGWFIAAMSVLCVPAGMIHAIYHAKGANLWQVSMLGQKKYMCLYFKC